MVASGKEFNILEMDMGHGGMDMGDDSDGDDGDDGMDMGHGGHNHAAMPGMCKMNMIFNWDTSDVCIVFNWWHIRGATSLAFSLLAVIALGVGYEFVRKASSHPLLIEERSIQLEDDSGRSSDSDPETGTTLAKTRTSVSSAGSSSSSTILLTEPAFSLFESQRKLAFTSRRILRSLVYAILVVYSFFIMLIAMTYNGWIIIMIGVGAFLGNLVFGDFGQNATPKGMSCH
ncbi:Ctr copper transporter family-domain-containing protein [Lipomyces oligophaga]|uniref:Ctr copper transporter family-domain-containing protein n=1 Tax=Lipomyces oligophaga TaxID=45792 RepID=UPI0034CFC63A